MLSIGWTEMMLIAAIALIVVGPKDLPAMLRQIGRVVGSVRRMGNEFRAELNKVTAIDEIKDIKQSIAAPLSETRQKIEEEFNSIAPDGSVVPSGKIVPADPDSQSVVDEIRKGAGLEPLAQKEGGDSSAARASLTASVTRTVQARRQGAQGANDTGAASAKAGLSKGDGGGAAKKTTGRSAKEPARKSAGRSSGKTAAGKSAGKTAKSVAAKTTTTKKTAVNEPHIVSSKATKTTKIKMAAKSVKKPAKSEAG